MGFGAGSIARITNRHFGTELQTQDYSHRTTTDTRPLNTTKASQLGGPRGPANIIISIFLQEYTELYR